MKNNRLRLIVFGLVMLLAINALMFVGEAVAGWWSESTGLLADSLDMFADASVYGISLYAVGRPAAFQRGAALMMTPSRRTNTGVSAVTHSWLNSTPLTA